MIDATFNINAIDYERTFANLYPELLQKSYSWKMDNPILRLLQKMGDDSIAFAVGFLRRLPKRYKDELLVVAMNSYSDVLVKLCREYLLHDDYGKYFTLEDVLFVQRETDIEMHVINIEVDYNSLVRDDGIRSKITDSLRGKLGVLGKVATLGVDVATGVVPEQVEKLALKLLDGEVQKEKMISLFQDIIHEKGLQMDISDIKLVQSEHIIGEDDIIIERIELSDELQGAVVDAMAEFLKGISFPDMPAA